MSDDRNPERPRPQYGEYATPEEQRARIQQPDVTWALETGAPPEEPVAAAPSAPPAKPARRFDRIVTFVLLGYGLFTVVTALPSLLDHAAYARTLFDLLGLDVVLSDPAAARPWGTAAAVVLALGWLVTAYVSWISVRARRLSFWIPLVGGIVFNTVSALLMLVPIMNDPAVLPALQSGGLG